MEKLIQVFCTVAAAALLAGCSGKSEDKIPGPVAFDKHDRCHICGMVILNYPGAKAQVFWVGAVGIGFLIPLALSFFGSKAFRTGATAFYTSGLAAICGMMCLRLFIIYAGQINSI